MRHYRSKTDGNHAAITRALRDAGRSVLDLASVGGGAPDILVGWSGKMLLMEIKNPQGRNRVQENQVDWHRSWHGTPVVVVRSPEEALRATGVLPSARDRAPAPT